MKMGLWFCPLLLCAACAGFSRPPQADTYYVSAEGSDRGSGLSEQTPFKSLFKAVVMAGSGPVKTITVIGTLNASSEQSSNEERVFLIQGMGKEQILIRGKAGTSAALSAAGSGRRTALVKGAITVRFEDIEISGGTSSGEGGGLGVGPGASVTLGPGAVIRNNRSENLGGGVVVAPGGTLYIEGSLITGNRSALVGGGVAVAGASGVLIVRDGEISGNHAQGGGGIAVYQGGTCTFLGGAVRDNTADLAGGGVVVNQGGVFTMEGGVIWGNRSSGSGGGAALLEGGVLVLKGGEIRGNRSAEHGGGIGSDNTSFITIQGGILSSNRAASWGGGVFTAGPFVKTGGIIAGSDLPETEANVSASGAAVFVFREEGNRIRNTSVRETITLDASAEDGWNTETAVSGE